MHREKLLTLFDNICRHQVSKGVHPMTCGNDSNHPPLFPVLEGGELVLRCAHCDYKQTFIPEQFGAEEKPKPTRHPHDGEPYYCVKCGLGYAEFAACEETICQLETAEAAQNRMKRYNELRTWSR
jgi:hypothetical protein